MTAPIKMFREIDDMNVASGQRESDAWISINLLSLQYMHMLTSGKAFEVAFANATVRQSEHQSFADYLRGLRDIRTKSGVASEGELHDR